MQVLGVVIPTLEELQNEGAVGQRKIPVHPGTSDRRRTLQATGLVFIFVTGRGTAFFSAGGAAPTCRVARWRVATWLTDHPTLRLRHRGADVDVRDEQPARYRHGMSMITSPPSWRRCPVRAYPSIPKFSIHFSSASRLGLYMTPETLATDGFPRRLTNTSGLRRRTRDGRGRCVTLLKAWFKESPNSWISA